MDALTRERRLKYKFNCLCAAVLILLFVSCSSANERLITGKWSLAGTMIGGAPSSFWFKGNGTVIAPWEKHNYAFQSSGSYEFVDDTHIKILMKTGYYSNNAYYFEIIKMDKKELILKSDYQSIRLKRD
ncbi:MAG TPA: hypothetical protein ENG83_01295 [Nitrospirae bacterium]|nr:hypothetical protein [Nitrospirota bacterium]HDL20304.1 hypothetical protein [Nitrospirota bacterium]HDZ01871.1 hypothetical protein [Nitrospirota bacterium]